MLFGKVFYKKCRGEIIARNASGDIVLLIKTKQEEFSKETGKIMAYSASLLKTKHRLHNFVSHSQSTGGGGI